MNVYVHATRRHHEPVREIVGGFLGVDELTAAGRLGQGLAVTTRG